MKYILLIVLFLSTPLYAYNFTECEEGSDFPSDNTHYNHHAYSTHVGFLWWYELDSEGYHHLLSKILDEVKISVLSEEIISTTPTRIYSRREILIQNIENSYYRDGGMVHVPVDPPETIVEKRLFSCIDYNFKD